MLLCVLVVVHRCVVFVVVAAVAAAVAVAVAVTTTMAVADAVVWFKKKRKCSVGIGAHVLS